MVTKDPQLYDFVNNARVPSRYESKIASSRKRVVF